MGFIRISRKIELIIVWSVTIYTKLDTFTLDDSICRPVIKTSNHFTYPPNDRLFTFRKIPVCY